MKEDLVSYETAQLAKEVGFDWPTKRLAVVDLVVIRRPTQCLLAKWLREEKGIDVETRRMNPLYYGCSITKINDELFKIVGEKFGSHKIAFESGLQEALKYLKKHEKID